ncbi:MAG: hypothetical protein HY689_08490 [Chloroflexi bacterium]|nr:hypothetical protein [Chloroflexota bacterium]
MRALPTRRTVWALLTVLTVAVLAVFSLPLTQVTAFPPDTSLPPEKQALEERYARDRATARQTPKDHQQGPPPQTPGQRPLRPRGLIEHGQAPFSSQDVVVRNQWQDEVNGAWVHVYAGALAGDPEQGMVVVVTESADGMLGTAHRYPTPNQSGAVRIVKAEGTTLVLVAPGGPPFTFDVQSGTFGQAVPGNGNR